MENVTDRVSNPFGMRPPCERYVPGYGDANADFHVVGDHPGVHGGADPVPNGGSAVVSSGSDAVDPAPESLADADETPARGDGEAVGVPFTNEAGLRLQRALERAGLLQSAGLRPTLGKTFFSYLHMCVSEGDPSEASYRDMERFFDAELRAIAAHVLLPVGERATRHVLRNYTARPASAADDMDGVHGQELLGSGFLVVPVAEPASWGAGDEDRLVAGLEAILETDYRRESDLGRFFAGGDPYLVR